MALTKLLTDLNNVQALDDEPNDVTGLTAAEVKAVFDEAGNEIKTYINDVLTAEIDVLPASSISVVPIPTLTGTEVQTVLESIKVRLDDVSVTNANAEVADSHVGADARTYATLSERLDTADTLDTTQALQVDLDAAEFDIQTNANNIHSLDLATTKKSEFTKGTNWVKFPNGEIHQWGQVTTPSTSIATSNGMWYSAVLFNFPIPFNIAVLSMNGWQTQNVNCWVSVYGSTSKTGSSVYVIGNDANVTKNKPIYWFAIGQ